MPLRLLPKFWMGAFICLVLMYAPNVSFAEGTKQLDPNTSDYTKLMTNNAAYGSFAEYDGSVNSRLFIHIANPNSELVYLGLSRGAVETFNSTTFEYLGDTYTPATNYVVQNQFAYEVCDDGTPQACAGAIVVIDIIPDLNGSSPNAPFAGDDFNLTNINTDVSGDLSTNDSGGDSIKTTPISDPSHGAVTINDLNITNFNITHSWTGDLTITLESPAGAVVTLFNRLCTNSVPGYDFTIDDEGTALAICGDLNDGGVRQPYNGVLSDFDNENSTGEWKLTVIDNSSEDTGNLNSWGLEIESPNEVCAQATAYILVMPPPVYGFG